MFADHHAALADAVRAQSSAVPQGWVGLAAVVAGVLMCMLALARRACAALPLRRSQRTVRGESFGDHASGATTPRPWHFGDGGGDR